MLIPNLLFIDDDPNVLNCYKRVLLNQCDHWRMHFLDCPRKAWELVQQESFDTVISDVQMPGITGLEFLSRMQADPTNREVPVIIVTGDMQSSLKRQALDLGAADLLNKPIHPEDLKARIRSVLKTKSIADQLKQQNELLEFRVAERTAQLTESRIDMLWRLSKAAEFRDEETGNHVIRVGSYSRAIAIALGLDDKLTETLFLAAPLHDIGKIGIPDSVLLKPGKLTADEWKVMRSHCQIGVANPTASWTPAVVENPFHLQPKAAATPSLI